MQCAYHFLILYCSAAAEDGCTSNTSLHATD